MPAGVRHRSRSGLGLGREEGSVPRQWGRPLPPAPCYIWPHNPEPSPEPISIPQGRGEGHLSQKKMVTIPSGSILAFRVAQLVIGPDWGEPGSG